MILTTGIKDAPVACRVELRTFLKDKDLTNLYILAVDQMMRIKQDDPSSWFQIAAIHGRPYIPYDDVGTKGNFGGYCCHSSILFPSWHRPYVALFEQCLSKHVHEIAKEYKDPADREKYCKAAERFRVPYWDWATEPTLPDIVACEEMVSVYLCDGSTTKIKNPLFGYFFNPVYSDFGDGLPDDKVWEIWQATYRYPTTTDAKAKSVPELMQGTLKNNRLSLRDRTYNILTQIKDYNLFSHDTSGGADHPPAGFDSIESIHNLIHGLAGRNGHMGVVDYAAFDPVFFMHHANVDRLFALWQCLHPDAYVSPLKSEAGTFTRKPGEVEDVNSPLTPFRLTSDTFWTSAEVRDTRVFNYTYPELSDLQSLPKEQQSIRLAQVVNKLYEPLHNPVTKAPPSGDAKNPPAEKKDATPHEWFVNIAVEKYACKSSFFVHLFLGEVDVDPLAWSLAKNLVGTHVIFANNAEYTGCEKCRDAHEQKKVVTGQVPLTGCLSLAEHLGGVFNLAEDTVAPYLKKNLHWRIQKHDGSPVNAKDVPSLKISVGHVIVDADKTSGGFPCWGDVKLVPI